MAADTVSMEPVEKSVQEPYKALLFEYKAFHLTTTESSFY
jgi:hypothetical protein